MWKSTCMSEEAVSTISQHGASSRASRLFQKSSQSNKSHRNLVKTNGTKSRRVNPCRSFFIALVSLRNILALLVFIGLNVATLIHDPIATYSVVRQHFDMNFHHEREQQVIPNLFCKDNGEESVLCLHDETGAYIMPTAEAITEKMKQKNIFKDEKYGNVTYGSVLYENNLLKNAFHYDTSCNELIRSALRHTWHVPVPFKQQCCTLTIATAGMFWNLCTTPPDEVLTPEGRAGELELRGPMMHATMGLIDQYYSLSGCRIEDHHSISYEDAIGMTDEEVAQINHLNCVYLELKFDVTDVTVMLGPIILFIGTLLTMICRILKLIKLIFLFLLTMKLNVFCYKRGLFFKTFSEDLMYSDGLIQKLNVLIGIFSFTTLTMHFGIWEVDHGMNGFFSSLHLVAWSEGIYTIVIIFAKLLKLRITSVNSFVVIILGTRYLLTTFAKHAYSLSDSCIEAGITGNYNIDSTITILIALLAFALSTVAIQFFMSGVVQMCFWGFHYNPYQKKTNWFQAWNNWWQKLWQKNKEPIEQVNKYRLSRFEQITGQDLSRVYGFAPVSHHQLLIKGVAYTPLEWVLTSGYFLYQGHLYEMSLRTCLWLLTNRQIGCLQAIPVAEYSNGTLHEIKYEDKNVEYDEMEAGGASAKAKVYEGDAGEGESVNIQAISKGSMASKCDLYKPGNKSHHGFIFTPL